MSAADRHAQSTANRRKWMRQYLDREMPVEVIIGARRFAIASGWINNVSRQGIGLRSAQPIRLPAGVPVTVATHLADQVVTVSGVVASSQNDIRVGITVACSNAQNSLVGIADSVKTVAVSNPEDGRTSVSGKMSMAARHPIQWALKAGVKRLDMRGVTELDSAGLGLLLLNHERHGLTVENCSSQICRLIDMTRLHQLCATDCPQRPR